MRSLNENLRDWHKRYSPSFEYWLQLTPEVQKADENLNTHRSVEPLPPVPAWLTLSDCANIVEWFEKAAMAKIVSIDQSDLVALGAAWDEAAARASAELTGRISADCLRTLWSGCLAAAKAISPRNYWTGPIGSWQRFLLFKWLIFPECNRNAWYRLGALSAPIFKMNRGEPITLRGVPLRTCGDETFAKWRLIGYFDQ